MKNFQENIKISQISSLQCGIKLLLNNHLQFAMIFQSIDVNNILVMKCKSEDHFVFGSY